ncbi:DUF11 domain-containing protein [Cellulomonas hominis]|uniref:DUF7927 domain-containing protein n=1 Tax=Cellulomonas hominis TaxID=156981 RepID=UPI001BCC650D|nr:DUF11 domain-containing protein [Cellulomonas hominis]
MRTRTAATVLAAALVAMAATGASAVAAEPGAEESSGATAGPTHVGQEWSVYVEAGGRVDVRVEISPNAATNGEPHAIVTEQPGTVGLVATSPSGQEQASDVQWDPEAGAIVADSFQDPAQDAGVWRVRLTATNEAGAPWAWGQYLTSEAWQIVPRDSDGTAHTGRVWVDEYLQSDAGMRAKGVSRWDQTHYLLSASGVTYRATQFGFNGIHSRSHADSLGLTDLSCQPIQHSTTAGDPLVRFGSTCPDVTRYRLFFETPDTTMPATAAFFTGQQSWVMPTYTSPSIPALTWSQTTPGNAWGGELAVTLEGQAGTVEVRVDVDDDGAFTGARDVTLTRAVPLGVTGIEWDGTDATGVPVPLSQAVRFQAELVTSGDIYFVHDDVEYRDGGIEVEAVNGPQAGSRALWWDDRPMEGCFYSDGSGRTVTPCIGGQPTALAGDGIDSTGGVHGWGQGAVITEAATTWGDGKHIQDWTHTTDRAVSAVLQLHGAVAITKAADVETLTAGDTTTHTWTVENTGSVDLLGLEVVDDLAAVLPAGDFDPDTITTTTGQAALDVDAQTLTWTGDLPAGRAATVEYQVHTNATAPVPTIRDTVEVTGWDATATVTQDITTPPAPALPAPPEPVQVVDADPTPALPAAAADPAPLAVTGPAGITAVVAAVLVLLTAGAVVVHAVRRRRQALAGQPQIDA